MSPAVVVMGGTWVVVSMEVPTGFVIITCCSKMAGGAPNWEASFEVVWQSSSSDDSDLL